MPTRAIRTLRRFGAFGLAPGLLDAGFGSLAGLAGSLYAVRYFDIAQLGLFSLFFLAFQLLGLLPRVIVVPAQVVALDVPVGQRTAVLRRSIPLSFLVALSSVPLVWLVVLLAPGGARADYIAFGLTTSAMVLVSPLQDHARFVLHMAGRSTAAVPVSAFQLLLVLAVIGVLHAAGVSPRWVPFLSLSIANVGSLTLALVLAAPHREQPIATWPSLRSLLASGGLLLPPQVLPLAGALAVAALVARLASTDALGAAEAARVVASPMMVAGVGLGQVLNPRLMEAGRGLDFGEMAAAIRLYAAAVAVLAGAYTALVGWSYELNLAELALPLAYSVAGLVALRIVAAAATVLLATPGLALLGMTDYRGLLLAGALAVVAQLAVAAAIASSAEAYTIPLAELTSAVVAAAVMMSRLPGLWPALFRRRSAVDAES